MMTSEEHRRKADPWAWMDRDARERKLAAAVEAWGKKSQQVGYPNTPQKLEALLEWALRAAYKA